MKKSDIVIKGRAIAVDTVEVFDMFVHSDNGIRVGRDKFEERRHVRLRYKVSIDTVYKSKNPLPDTVYILTGSWGSGCGLLVFVGIPMLISADNKVDKEIIEVKKNRKTRRQIKSTVYSDTFVTSTCHYARYFTDEISKHLRHIRPNARQLKPIKTVNMALAKPGLWDIG